MLAEGKGLAVPDCVMHRDCGGCSWQRVSYPRQLKMKLASIREAFAAAEIEDVPLEEIRRSPRAFGYRNLMEFSFSARRWLSRGETQQDGAIDRDFSLGLHAPGGIGRVLQLERCSIQDDPSNAIMVAVREFARSSGLGAWDHRSHEGFWRFLRLRSGYATGENMVAVVTSRRDDKVMGQLVRRLGDLNLLPTTLANGVTDRVADTSEGANYFIDHGPEEYAERLAGFDYRIGPASFFQPNTQTAELIVAEVMAMARLKGHERVIDLFCGAGTLSLPLASQARELRGYEVVESSVAAARKNADRNGVSGTHFEVFDLNAGYPTGLSDVDVVVTDPPRSGMHRRLLAGLIEASPPVIISVGCNPKTQAENLAVILASGKYRLEGMVGVDQFPQTPHVENLARLTKID